MNNNYEINDSSRLHSPSLVLFKDVIERNLVRMIEIAGSVERLRPHCKTHKMEALIEWELELGITRHKCATIAEAEMLARCGVADIFLAYNPVGPNIDRIGELIERYPLIELKVTADHPDPLRQLDQRLEASKGTAEVLLDVNSGMNRTGISIGEAAVQLYQQISECRQLRPGGLHVYDGHNRQQVREERCQAVGKFWSEVVEFKGTLRSAGLPVPRIVAGGTGSFPCFAAFEEEGLELSPGTVVFYDAGYQENFPDLDFEPAALILSRVISRPADDLITLDLGHKACAADPPAGSRVVIPAIPDKEEIQQSEEHLVIRTQHAAKYAPGDVVLAIPWHACPTSAVHQRAYVIENGDWVDTWPVTSRDRCLAV